MKQPLICPAGGGNLYPRSQAEFKICLRLYYGNYGNVTANGNFLTAAVIAVAVTVTVLAGYGAGCRLVAVLVVALGGAIVRIAVLDRIAGFAAVIARSILASAAVNVVCLRSKLLAAKEAGAGALILSLMLCIGGTGCAAITGGIAVGCVLVYRSACLAAKVTNLAAGILALVVSGSLAGCTAITGGVTIGLVVMGCCTGCAAKITLFVAIVVVSMA